MQIAEPSVVDFRQRIYNHQLGHNCPPIGSIHDLDARATFLRRWIQEHIPPDREISILDLGCGHGALIHFLREAGYRDVTGVDVSAVQVEASRRLGISGVRREDLLECLNGLASGSQGALVTFDVLEHLSKPEILSLTDEVFRVLRPGARWLIHTPNAEGPFGARMRYGDFTHEIAFTRESISQLLLSSGFRNVCVYEDTPAPHGVKSAFRFLLWKAIRFALRLYLFVETGSGQAILSQNFTAIATK